MRILIIEDELSLAEAIQELLKRENYLADLSVDGVSGLHQALTGIYDVIILDIMLPGMDGFKVVNQIRLDGVDTPILMLTARLQLEDKVRGLDVGADDYLTKPFETQELLARIRALARRTAGKSENSGYHYGDIELDIKSCELKCIKTGKKIKLSAKEYAILEYLMINKNQVISREQIVEKVWGYENDSEYNNVEVYISFTRKKITFVGSAVKIKAMRGIGYMLEETEAKL